MRALSAAVLALALPLSAPAGTPSKGITDVHDYGTAYYACEAQGWDAATVNLCQRRAADYFGIHIDYHPRPTLEA
jgi:hypothetical protein